MTQPEQKSILTPEAEAALMNAMRRLEQKNPEVRALIAELRAEKRAERELAETTKADAGSSPL